MGKLMKCGHVAQGTAIVGGEHIPVCVICDCIDVAEYTPDLEGRKAKCHYCGAVVESNLQLPFFGYCPDHEYDDYYCGCYGWD